MFFSFGSFLHWWFSDGIRAKACLLMSPGLFSVIWPISTMVSFGWSPLVLLFPSPLVPLMILLWLYLVHQLQLLSPSLSCSIYFSVFKQGLVTFGLLSVLHFGQPEWLSPLFGKFSFLLCFFFLSIRRSGHLVEIRRSACMSKSHRG